MAWLTLRLVNSAIFVELLLFQWSLETGNDGLCCRAGANRSGWEFTSVTSFHFRFLPPAPADIRQEGVHELRWLG